MKRDIFFFILGFLVGGTGMAFAAHFYCPSRITAGKLAQKINKAKKSAHMATIIPEEKLDYFPTVDDISGYDKDRS
jgi:hypothetical protein